MVRLIVYNIEYCEGIAGLWYDYLKFWKIFFPPKGLDQRIVEHIKRLKPDILALVEVDTGSFRSKKDEVAFFEKKLGMSNFVERVKYPFEGWLKLFHYIPILNKQANAIIAKEKLSNVKYHVFHEGTKRVVIEATIHVPKKVTLLLAHLALGEKTRAEQIKELIKIVNNIKNPVILMGDFNTFNGEVEIKKLLKETHLHHKFEMDKTRKNHRFFVSRKFAKSSKIPKGFLGHQKLQSNFLVFSRKTQTLTEPAYHPSRRLDYVLTSKGIKVKNYEVLNFHFSDHLPLLVDFRID